MEKPILITALRHWINVTDLPPQPDIPLLIWTSTRKGHLNHRHKTYPIKAGRLFFFPKGATDLSINWDGWGWLIAFAPHFLRNFLLRHPEEQLLPIFRQGRKPYADILPATARGINTLIGLLPKPDEPILEPRLAQHYLSALLLHLAGAYRRNNHLPARSPSYPIVVKLMELILTYYREQRLPPFYAGQLGMTVRKLNEAAKRATGQLVQELVTEQVLAEAERLLAESPHSIKEIAYKLDFADMASLSVARKKYYTEETDAADYKAYKSECEEEIVKLEAKLGEMSEGAQKIDKVLHEAVENVPIISTGSITGLTAGRGTARRWYARSYRKKSWNQDSGKSGNCSNANYLAYRR